jgi:hypothetical protein
VDRCGSQRLPVRWFPCRICPDDRFPCHSCPGRTGQRRDPGQQSCGQRAHRAHRDRLHSACRAAIPTRQRIPGIRVVSRPIAAVTSGAGHALGVDSGIDSGHAVEVAFGQAIAAGLILGRAVEVALDVTLGQVLGFFVPVADRLSQPSQRRSWLRQAG